jgi:hypothetical protein
MNTKAHVGFWMSVFLILFLLNPIFRDGSSMERFLTMEMQLTRNTFGDRTADWLQDKASIVFGVYTPAGTVRDAAVRGKDMELTKRVVPGPGVALTHAFNSYVEGLVLNFFVVTLRLFIFALWFLILLPVFVAAVIDGFVQRAIKRDEFGAIRPAAFSLTSMIVIPLAMAPIVYLSLPVPVSPLVSPLWALLMALPLSSMVSNSQPIFGRA